MINHILDKVPCGLVAFSDEGTILAVNDTLCKVLNHDQAALIGKNVA